MLTRFVRVQKALNAIASNTIGSLCNILPTGFVVHFELDRLSRKRQRSIAACLLYLLCIFDKKLKKEKFKERDAVN